MNSLMTITIRVQQGDAVRAVKQMSKTIDEMDKAAGKAEQAVSRMQGAYNRLDRLEKFGKDLQWTGRQIEYRFTLPLLAAGVAAGKFAMDNERAMVRLQKVYGTFAGEGRNVQQEIKDLGRAFEALSNIFGVHQDQVIQIGADWAAAGAEGIAVAKATRLTLEAMILGELDAATAGKALISIMQQYGMVTDDGVHNTEDLTGALEVLNMIENQTAISMSGLIEVLERSAAGARTAGIDLRHLSAMAAALVPATGSAERAGNGLRTIISRLMVPSNDAAELMGEMGINIYDASWQASNGVQRFERMAHAFNGLSQAQQNIISAFVASRFQINRFDTLMRDIVNDNGNYRKALDATADAQKNFAQYQEEIGKVLASSPQGFSILMTQLQNAAARIIVPFIPLILALTDKIVGLVDAFSRLDPGLQMLIVSGLAFLAILGPLMAYVGVFGALVGRVGKSMVWFLSGVDGGASGLVRLGGGLKFVGGILWDLLALPVRPLIAMFSWFGGGLVRVMSMGGAAVARFAAFAATHLTALTAWLATLPVSWPLIIGAAIAAMVVLAVMFRDDLGRYFGQAVDWVSQQLGRLPGVIVAVFNAVVRTLQSVMRAVVDALSYLNPFARHSPSLVDQVTEGVEVIASKYASLSRIGATFRHATSAMQAFGRATAAASAALKGQERGEQRQVIVSYAPQAGGEVDAMYASIDALEGVLERLGAEYEAQGVVVGRWARQVEGARARVDELKASSDQLEAALEAAKGQLDSFTDAPLVGMRTMSDAIFENEMAQKRLRLELLRMEEAGVPIEDTRDRLAKLAGEIEELRARSTNLRLAGAGSDVLGPINAQIDALTAMQATLRAGAGGTQVEKMQDELDRLGKVGERLDLERSLQFDPLTRQIEQMTDLTKEMTFDEVVAGIQRWQPEVAALTAQHDQATAALRDQEAELTRLTAIHGVENDTLRELGDTYDDVEGQIRSMESALNAFASQAEAAARKAKAATDEASSAVQQFQAAAAGDYEVPGGGAALGHEEGDIGALADQWAEEAKKAFGTFDIFAPLKESATKAWEWVRTEVGIPGGIGAVIGGIAGFVIGGPWGAAIGAGLGAVLGPPIWGALKDAWQWVKDQWNGLGIGETIGGPFERVGAVIRTVWDRIREAIQAAWDFISPIFDSIVGSVQDHLMPVFEELYEFYAGIWDGIVAVLKWVWEKIVEPIFGAIVWFVEGPLTTAFGFLRTVAETVFGFIGGLIDAWWNHLVRPIFDLVVWVLTHALGPAFELFRAIAVIAFELISRGIRFAWENGISPIFDGIAWALGNVVGPAFNWLWENIVEPVMGHIGTAIDTAWNYVIKPIFEALDWAVRNVVGPVFDWLVGVVSGAFDLVVESIRTGVQMAIDIFNTLAKGVNWVADKLGLSVSVTLIPDLNAPPTTARRQTNSAGQVVGLAAGGFITRGAQAIVGEGRQGYPEYVIPTDPRHRDRASALFAQLGGKLGPAAGGGWWDDLLNGARSVFATNIFRPFLDQAMGGLEGLHIPVLSGLVGWARDRMVDWVKGVESIQDDAAGIGGQNRTGGQGGRYTDQMLAVRNLMLQMFGGMTVGGYAPRNIAGTNTPSAHSRYRAWDFMVGGNRAKGDAISNWLVQNGGPYGLKGLIWYDRSNYGSGWKPYRHPAGGNNPTLQHRDHVHAEFFDQGGWLKPGLTLAYNGTGRSERVLTADGRGPGGGRELHFHGDLSFPNVRSGDDAEAFIRNLERLVD